MGHWSFFRSGLIRYFIFITALFFKLAKYSPNYDLNAKKISPLSHKLA